jgi:rubrerythrin
MKLDELRAWLSRERSTDKPQDAPPRKDLGGPHAWQCTQCGYVFARSWRPEGCDRDGCGGEVRHMGQLAETCACESKGCSGNRHWMKSNQLWGCDRCGTYFKMGFDARFAT